MPMPAHAFIACFLSAAATAGPIDPPTGPVEPTMKTLDQVEPRIPLNSETAPGNIDYAHIIAEPGSYYLTGNLVVNGFLDPLSGVVFDRNAILITSENVTLDLNGYAITTNDEGDTAIAAISFLNNITIRNGSIVGFDETGINIPAAFTPGSSGGFAALTDLVIMDCGRVGIDAFNADVRNVRVERCLEGGINAKTVRNSIARESGSARAPVTYGIQAEIVESCESSGHSIGISILGDGVIRDSRVTRNDLIGIQLTGAGQAERCVARGLDNTGVGFEVSVGTILRACVARNLNTGFRIIGVGNQLIENTAISNTDGFVTGSSAEGNTFRGNLAQSNSGNNWDVADNNLCLVVRISGTSSVLGDDGGTTLTNNPWANFTR